MRIGSELVWRLKGQSPETISMSRLAEYMHQLAVLFGQQAGVRFVRVEEGSLNVVAKTVGGGRAGQIAKRVEAVRRRSGPADAMRAYNRINEMVFEDGGPARLTGSATVLHFPGARPKEALQLKLVDYGDVTGKLYALAEQKTGEVGARIRPTTGNNAILCTASREIGLRLRAFLFEAVRVFGQGTWVRGEDGVWACENMFIDDVRPIKNVRLREAIESLRAIECEWPDDPLQDLADLNEVSRIA